MKYLTLYIFFTASFFISSCKSKVIKKDNLLNHVNSHPAFGKKDNTVFYLDSAVIISFLQRYPENESYSQQLKLFYKKRNDEFAWISNAGVNEYARNFINLLSQEEKSDNKDAVVNNTKLHMIDSLLSGENYKFSNKDSLVIEFELLLTSGFFDYARRNWKGSSDESLVKVGWFIARKKLNYENLLDTLLINNPHTISSFDPVYRQYGLLKKYLSKYRNIEKAGGWGSCLGSVQDLKKGDSSEAVACVRKQLYMLEDLSIKDSTRLFNAALEDAVKKFQKRYGLTEDGIISGKTLDALRVPLHDQIQQLLINMERSRWVPIEQKDDYLLVNIPAFKLYVYHNDSLEWTCNAIVGKSKLSSNTVIFNDSMQYIVFSPYWNIPQSILFKETLPEIKKSSNYLESHNMEVVTVSGKAIPEASINWNGYINHFPYIIRQKPGKDNALGQVKFLFPNAYDIYMHDTPAKSLFGESTRMFSHGCIRLAEPYKLARFLLREDTSWTKEKIKEYMNGGKQTFVKLKKKVPVFIAYFTAWVDRSGKLNIREDIYHHDAKMKRLLFAN